jgi:hypothetical protein
VEHPALLVTVQSANHRGSQPKMIQKEAKSIIAHILAASQGGSLKLTVALIMMK